MIVRELFPEHLRRRDLHAPGTGVALAMIRPAARQEVRALLETIGLADAAEQVAAAR